MASGLYMVPPASRKQICEFANGLREKWGWKNNVLFPVMDLLELVIPAVDSSFELDIVDDYELGADHANYNPVKNQMRIRQSVYVGACANKGRDRFTIAHEIGHYFLHSNITLSRVETSYRIPAYRDPEWQANTFASALLLPDHIIEKRSVFDIAKNCGTSYRAAEIAYNRKNGQA